MLPDRVRVSVAVPRNRSGGPAVRLCIGQHRRRVSRALNAWWLRICAAFYCCNMYLRKNMKCCSQRINNMKNANAKRTTLVKYGRNIIFHLITSRNYRISAIVNGKLITAKLIARYRSTSEAGCPPKSEFKLRYFPKSVFAPNSQK